MEFIQCLLYGLISGITEILPVSSQAHQGLLRKLLGISADVPLVDLMVHAGILLAIVCACYSTISRLQRERKARQKRRSYRQPDFQSTYESRLLRTAVFPLCIGLLFYPVFSAWEDSLWILALVFAVNGVILCISGYMRQSNKNASLLSGADALLMGASGALSAVPGISRIGTITTAAMARGAGRDHGLNWALLLSIPALAVFMVFDVIALFGSGFAAVSLAVIAGSVGAAAAAFAGSYISIVLIQFMIVKLDLSGFSYYCWGAAMLSFILYLMI